MAKKPYYITTAIAYTSGKPHIGNTYEAILADAIARFKRKQGYDVFFQTGTDEHGQKIQEKAEAAGITPQAYVDKIAGEIKDIWDLVGTSYDKFIRTTDEDHMKQVGQMFKKFYDQGDIYKGYYEGMYCTPCESFWTESQLVDGKCPDCGRDVKPAREEAYFFKMGKYADRLIEHINTHPEFIQPVSRKNEMMNNFLLKGLQDLCVSRTSFTWGIPVEFDPRHVTYVWMDALSNYITGIGYDVDGNHTEQYKKYWPADLHLIGKDFIPEIIDPNTGEVLPAGEQGELVITCIKKEGLPLIRYRTKDITRLFYEKCKCGRTFCRMENLSGRSDDMLKIRGVNVFPSQIEEVILSVEELGPHYEIILEREGYLDKLTVKVELAHSTDSFSELERITGEVKNKLKIILGLDAKIKLESPNTLQRFEGKAKRVKDLRRI